MLPYSFPKRCVRALQEPQSGCASRTCDCSHPPGSFFPIGNTLVRCTATDKHGNSSSNTFTVSVGDTTPPVLHMPTVVTAIATTRNGARVTYTVTATDNFDPNPTVKCTPPSGAQFPLGPSPVKCTATDHSGNTSQGTFIVKVIVAWVDSTPVPARSVIDDGIFLREASMSFNFSECSR